MNGFEVDTRHPWQRPVVPPVVAYALVVLAYTAFTVALLYILMDSPT